MKELKNSTNISDAVALTSTDLKINSIKFMIRSGQIGGLSGPIVQPRVTFFLNVQIGGGPQERIFQTTISQRNINKSPT